MDPVKINPSDFNTISTLDNDKGDDGSVTYFCNYCNTKLYYQSTDELTGKKIYWCRFNIFLTTSL